MQQLGIFPSFQYSDDPAVNPLLNAHVTYPPGMYQTSAQPPGAYYGSRADGLGGPVGNAWQRIKRMFSPRTARLHGTSSIGSAVSGVGTLIVLGLATYGGYTVYKHHAGK